MLHKLAMLALTVALVAVPTTASAAGSVSMSMAPAPIRTSSQYNTVLCGLRKNTSIVVNTTGPNYFFTQKFYTTDAQGCASYWDTSGSVAGKYGLTIGELRGSRYAAVGNESFDVVAS